MPGPNAILNFPERRQMFKATLKFDKDLIERIKKCSELAGYSSPEEFVQHIVEKELARLEDAESDEEIVKKMKGLGYLE
jgi:metal-responsive CopG/Arc/MetJ family transcriptional regulator